MPLKQFARGLFAQFPSSENPFAVANGMDANLRLIDDHLGLYTLAAPVAAGSAYPPSPANGDGQIYNNGSYATYNANTWRNYPARRGIRAVLPGANRQWVNSGSGWVEVFDLLTQQAREAAEAARDAAISAGRIYPTSGAGITDTVAGDYFFVPVASPSTTFYELYRNVAGVATLINIFPSLAAISATVFAKATLAALEADLGHPADRIALVTEDPDEANNTFYKKTGAPGAGGWLAIAAFSLAPLRAQVEALNDLLVANFLFLSGVNFSVSDQAGNVSVRVEDDGAMTVAELGLGEDNRIVFRQTADFALCLEDGAGNKCLAVTLDGQLLVADAIIENLQGAGGSGSSGGVLVGNYPSMILHLISYGQSLAVGVGATPPISTTDPYDNLRFASGVISDSPQTAFVPLTEVGFETPISGAAQCLKQLIQSESGIAFSDQAFQLLGTAPGQGGEPIGSLQRGSTGYNLLLGDVANAFSVATGLDKSYSVGAVIWSHGESDTASATTAAAYKAAMVTLMDHINEDVEAENGQGYTIPFIGYQLASWSFYSGTTEIALAVLALTDEDPRFHISTPLYMLPYADNVHLTAQGSKIMGAYNGLAIKRVLIDQVAWKPLRPLSARVQGKTARIKFHVPTPPLVFDTEVIAAIANNGFQLVNSGGGALTLTSVLISQPDCIDIVAAANIPAGARLRYGWTLTTAGTSGPTTGPRGALRDSQGDNLVFEPEGIAWPLHNWCVVFEFPL